MAVDDSYVRAAAAILEADYLLVCAGAGFSADSGLPVYKDVADLAAYRARKLTYADLCTPDWFERDPATAFGFWGSCFNSYADATPHEGYDIVGRWRDFVIGRHLLRRASSACRHPAGPSDRPAVAAAAAALSAARAGGERPDARQAAPAPCCVFTSNVDGFFRRSGWSEASIFEIHGAVERWQCCGPCERAAADGGHVWALDASHRFVVDQRSMKAPRHRPAKGDGDGADGADGAADGSGCGSSDGDGGSDGCGESSDEAERADSADSADSADGSTDGSEDADGSEKDAEGSGPTNFVHCSHCGGLARPCVLMFDDGAWVGETASGPLGPGHSQARSYRAWEKAVKAEMKAGGRKRLVVLEVGSGLRVPTVRQHSERLLRHTLKFGGRLIRINPDYPECKGKLAAATISIRDTCLDALRKIDAHVHAACARHGVAPERRPTAAAAAHRSHIFARLVHNFFLLFAHN